MLYVCDSKGSRGGAWPVATWHTALTQSFATSYNTSNELSQRYAMSLQSMRQITQEEVNKACASRNYTVLSEMLAAVRIELLIIDEEIEQAKEKGEPVSRSMLFNKRIILLNIDRLEQRIKDIHMRNLQRSQKAQRDKDLVMLALARAEETQKKVSVQQQITDAKNKGTVEDLKFVDPVAYKLALKYQEGKSFDQIAEETKDKDAEATKYRPTHTPPDGNLNDMLKEGASEEL